MDIKLKSKIKIGVWAFVILLLFSYGFSGTLQLIANGSQRFKSSYFETEEFLAEINDFIDLFTNTQLDYEMRQQMIKDLPEDIPNNVEHSEITIEETKEYNEDLTIKIREEQSRFEYKQNYIKYFIQERSGKKYTNLKENETYQTVKDSSYFIKKFPYHTKGNDTFTTVNHFFITRELTGFIAILKSDEVHSLVVENMYDYEDTRSQYFMLLGINIAVLIISLILGLLFIKKYGKEFINLIDPIKKHYTFPIDIKIVAWLINLFILSIMDPIVFYQMNYRFYYRGSSDLLVYTVFLALLIIQGLLLFPTFQSIQQIKTEWNKSFIVKTIRSLSDSFIFKSSVIKILFILGTVSILGIMVGIVLPYIEPVELLILFPVGLIPTVPILIYIFNKLAYFNRIIKYSEDIIEGRINSDMVVKNKGALSRLADNINRVRQGIDYSHKVQLKSERLKTELITNVSHDLRTPLTSIMNYSALLKKEDTTDEERKKYIEIIEQKSKRLKVLIDDLFEVSKMASGNIELSIEKVDMVQLMNQALAEYDEKIKDSSLKFKVSSSNPKIYARVDGRKMWRVFDNIINNILKYSLEKTRVYISIKETDKDVIIDFKNISNYELEENIEELLERFKRGDESRNTEGSGLGLAIAQSIVDNHGGNLDIKLDGDLFKTIVTLNK